MLARLSRRPGKPAGWSHQLARQAAISLSLLRKIEQGDRALTGGVRAAIVRVLGPLPG